MAILLNELTGEQPLPQAQGKNDKCQRDRQQNHLSIFQLVHVNYSSTKYQIYFHPRLKIATDVAMM